MWPFKHKHKSDSSKSRTKIACSILTGVSVQVSYTKVCSCGKILEKTVSPAGYQQLSWGADYDSLFDDGPIRIAEGKEKQVEAMQELFNQHYGFKSV